MIIYPIYYDTGSIVCYYAHYKGMEAMGQTHTEAIERLFAQLHKI